MSRLGQGVTVDVLPDDVLLAIFDFYVVKYQVTDLVLDDNDAEKKIELWQSLVHVCRRWRGLVFASPRRLNLQLFCIPSRTAKKTLDVWPALPLLIRGGVSKPSVDIAVAQLEHSDRIRLIALFCDSYLGLEKHSDSNARAISGARSSAPITWKLGVPPSSSRFILGWICATSAIPRLGFHSVSGFTETIFIYHSPRPS